MSSFNDSVSLILNTVFSTESPIFQTIQHNNNNNNQNVFFNSLIAFINGFIFVMGFISNILCFIICLRPNMRSQSTFRWLAALSVSDFIVNWIISFWLVLVFGSNGHFMMKVVNKHICQLRYSILVPSMTTSAWIIVMISIERLVCIMFPLKVHLFANKFANVGIPTIYTVLGSLFIFTYVGYDYSNGNCVSHKDFYHLYQVIVVLFGILYSYIPLSLILVLNIAIIYKNH